MRENRNPTFGIFFFHSEDGIRDLTVTGVQTCALPISARGASATARHPRDASRLFDGAARPAGSGEGDRPTRRRNRTRVLVFLGARVGRTRRERIEAWTGPTRAGRARVPPWPAAGSRLQ